MTLAEPTTALTDALVAAVAGGFAVGQGRAVRARDGAADEPNAWWPLVFAAVSFTALLGAVYHGFGPRLGEARAAALWTATLLGAGAVGATLFAAAWSRLTRGRVRAVGVAVALVKFALYAAWVVERDDYVWAIADSGAALLAVAALQAWAWRRGRDPAARWLAGGVAVSVAAALVQASGVGLHRHLNHNDLYHLLQIPGLWLFHRGARMPRGPGGWTQAHGRGACP